MDYDFGRLNSRSFEQLVQALGLRTIGPELKVFGDGPDGGREATFQGPVTGLLAAQHWNGLGVMQAKFHQKPRSSHKQNADWALAQLKLEFKKFASRGRSVKRGARAKRTCPDYYIFATNLVLTPVQGSGGKDRVCEYLDSLKRSHGLKGYLVWDYDQIRAELDANVDVRTSYSAWLTPGDVLEQMRTSLGTRVAPSFISTIRRYLTAELLDDQYARLSQGGYTDAKTVPLAQVFVDLPVGVEEAGSNQNFLEIFLDEGRDRLRPADRRERTGGFGRFVLVGGPGQGKTTLGQFACQLYRAEIIADGSTHHSPEVQRALDALQSASLGLATVGVRRFPLRVDLKHFASELAAAPASGAISLFDYLCKRIAKRANATVSFDDFRGWLTAYPWLLVLDGLDEVPPASNRSEVMKAITEFIEIEAHEASADMMILATTRPQGYANEFDSSFYRHLVLSPLSAPQAVEYGGRLARARHPGQDARVEELVSSLQMASRNSASRSVMQSPLQVTILLALIEGGGQPPEHRWKLFRDYYDVIYRREKERDTLFSELLRRYEPDIHWIHHRAAWLLQGRNARSGATDARLSHSEFEDVVEARLSEAGHEHSPARAALVRDIREAATNRLVLLVGSTAEEIGFEIRSLQEFMASEHLFDGGERAVRTALVAIGSDSYWRNVFLFAAGRIYFERQELVGAVNSVCLEMNESEDPALRRTFAGSRLALALLKDGAARNHPRSLSLLARCATRALEADGDELAPFFAELCDGSLEAVWREEVTARVGSISEGPLPRTCWWICMVLCRDRQWARSLVQERLPWGSPGLEDMMRAMRARVAFLPPEFWSIFAGHAFEHSLTLCIAIGRFLSEETLRRLPPQFYAVARAARTHGAEAPLVLPSGLKVNLGLLVRGEKWLSMWLGEHEMSTVAASHEDWSIFNALLAFRRDPEPDQVARTFRTINSTLFSRALSIVLPWQIRACVAEALRGRDWDDLMTAVQSGALGTSEDWVAWERELLGGVPVDKVLLASDELSINNSQLGLAASDGWFRGHDVAASALLSLAREILSLSSRGAFPFGVLEVVLHALLEEVGVVEEVFLLLRIYAERDLTANGELVERVVLSTRTAYTFQALELLGKCKMGPVRPRPSDRASVVREVARDVPLGQMCQPVLRALSYLNAADTRVVWEVLSVAHREGVDSWSSPYREAAIVLQANALNWTLEQAQEWAGMVWAARSLYAAHVKELLDAIDRFGMAGSNVEVFVMKLLDLAKQDHHEGELVQLLGGALVRLVERRPSVTNVNDPKASLIESAS